MNKIFNDKMEKRYRRLVAKGLFVDEICDDLGINKSTLFRHMRKRELPRPLKPTPLPKKHLPTIEEYKQFKREEILDTKIAKMCGVSSRTLWKWKIKMGLQGVRKKKATKILNY